MTTPRTDDPGPPAKALGEKLPKDPLASFTPKGERPSAAQLSASISLSRWSLSSAPVSERGTETIDLASIREVAPGKTVTAPAYSMHRIVGTGGYGEVWEATQGSLGRRIAVKRLREDIYEQHAEAAQGLEQLENGFRQEAVTTGSLEHPNIVPVHDLGVDEAGRPLLAMKLVRGKPWHEMIRDDAAMEVPDFLARHLPILIDVAQAAAFAHSRGIIHRDIKPSQVMVGEFGEVLLMDWGLAIVVDENLARAEVPELIESRSIPTIRDASNPAGTPAFMAPEQTASDAHGIGTWTDIYLLGGTLYYLLTLTVPHNPKDPVAAFYQAIEGEVERPEVRVPGREIPLDLAEVCMSALSRDPAQRIRGARLFIDALQDYLSGATRRRESNALTAGVSDLLQRPERSYEDLAECDNMLLRALGLWPENPRAVPLREYLLTEYARLAMKNHDLVLARVQAERLHDDHEREGLLREVGTLEGTDRKKLRQRRYLFVASIILSLAVALGAIFLRGAVQRTAEESSRTELAQEQASRISTTAVQLGRVNDLRQRETGLAERLARAVPVPDSLLASPGSGADSPDGEAHLKALLEECAQLREERHTLEKEGLDERLGEQPLELLLAEANITLALAKGTVGYLRAFETYREAAAGRRDAPEPLTGMGVSAARAGYLSSAVVYLAEATSATLVLRGENHPDYARALVLEAEATRNVDVTGAAQEERYRAARATLEPRWADLSLLLADQSRELGDYEQALAFATPTLGIFERRHGENHAQTANACQSIARSLQKTGKAADAAPYFERAYKIRSRLLTDRNLDTIESMHELGENLDALGKPEQAAEWHLKALEFSHIAVGEQDPRTASLFDSLARNCAARGKTDEAEGYFRKAIQICESLLGPNHPETARSDLGLGELLLGAGRAGDAEPFLRKATGIRLDALGELHPDSGEAMAALARALMALGRKDEAEAWAEKAVEALAGTALAGESRSLLESMRP